MAKRVVPVIIVVLLVGFFGYRTWQKKQAEKKDKSFYGTVEVTEAVISPQVSGRIVELNAVEGGKVSPGTLVVRLDETLYRAQIDSARAALDAVLGQEQVLDANLAALRQSQERARKLYQAGAGPKMAWEDLAKQAKVIEAQKDALHVQAGQAQAAIDLATRQLEYASIHAPRGGTVLRVHAQLGETAFPGTALMTIADLSAVEVRIYVPEPMLGKIKLGQKVEIKTDSDPDRPVAAKVSWISDQAEFTPKNVQTREERVRLVYAVKVTADNQDGMLKIGMPVDAYFQE
jgi:HlyD family secretion protein